MLPENTVPWLFCYTLKNLLELYLFNNYSSKSLLCTGYTALTIMINHKEVSFFSQHSNTVKSHLILRRESVLHLN